MKIIRVDLREFETKQEIQEYLKKECDFPEYYGCNLDALYDCLSENPCFAFEIVHSIDHLKYEEALLETMEAAGCPVALIME